MSIEPSERIKCLEFELRMKQILLRNLIASIQTIVAKKVLAARRKYFYAVNLN